MAEEPVRPSLRERWPAGWRGAILVVGAVISAIPTVAGTIFAISPCGGDFCMNTMGWVFAFAGLALFGAVLLFATGRTAAPLYVACAFLGGGVIIRGPTVGGEIAAWFVVLVTGVGLLALADMRSQTRSTLAALAVLTILAIISPPSSKDPITRWFALMLAVLPTLPWLVTSWYRRRSRAPAADP